ncbi:MAG TPA: glycoside hydrolase family 16 protein [Caulobacteraceae bacterium]|jgi:beta-glucanase (GH16 family)
MARSLIHSALAVGLALGVLSWAVPGRAPAAPADDAPLTKAPDGRRLAMSFSSDFTRLSRVKGGAGASGGIWRTAYKEGSHGGIQNRTLENNKELEVYVDPEMPGRDGQPLGVDPFQVHDGQLDLIAQPATPKVQADIGGRPYTSGLISNQPSFSQTYGYFEARVKLPKGKGLWPAVWMLPSDFGWPPEIDIMESIGNPLQAFMTVHSGPVPTKGVEVHPTSDGFHTYAVAWDAQNVVFYLDGMETQRMATPSDMHKPMYVVANLALGGDWAGTPDASTAFPARFTIQYIRAYRFAQ